MYGRSGMTWQLETNAQNLGVQHALIKWLHHRCTAATLRALYRSAVTRYLESAGNDLLIVGVLLRDSECDERDIASRARHLARRLAAPTQAELMAWYLPLPINQWAAGVGGPA